MIPGSRVRRRVAQAILGMLLVGPGGFFAWRWEVSNLDTLRPGQIYRAGQMTSTTLARTIREREIKTVLNLRGVNASDPWYLLEREATTTSGATLVDISMSSCQWMSRAQLRAVVKVLDRCDYPLLIHCQWGAERTGLISAFSELLRPGSTLDDAKKQFSLYYMYVRVKDGKIMSEHLEQYESWLSVGKLKHSPKHFRDWVKGGYVPRRPGREDWPYDPYPLVVVTRPAEKSRGPSESLENPPRPIALGKENPNDDRPR